MKRKEKIVGEQEIRGKGALLTSVESALLQLKLEGFSRALLAGHFSCFGVEDEIAHVSFVEIE